VSGFLICEQCARNFHGHPDDAEYYHGKVPNEIAGGPLFDETFVDETVTEVNRVVVILVGILLAIVLMLVLLI